MRGEIIDLVRANFLQKTDQRILVEQVSLVEVNPLGNVLDPSSAAIGGATVTVTSVGTSQQRSVQTSASGEYSIPLLPIGDGVTVIQKL